MTVAIVSCIAICVCVIACREKSHDCDTAFSIQYNLHARQWGPFYLGRTRALGTSPPSRGFLRK